LRQEFTLHQSFGRQSFGSREKHEGGLAAVSIGRVVFATQFYFAAGQDPGQCRCAVRRGFLRRDRLDAGKPNLAAVLEAKGARIENRGDAAPALRFEGASRGLGRTGGSQEQDHAERDRRPARALKFARCCR
jgi:hypothetical protein